MALQGYNGSVLVGATTVASASAWTLDMQASVNDVTTFADGGWSNSCAGLRSWSGTITCTFTAGTDAGEALLIDSFKAGTQIALELNTPASSAAPAGAYEGNAVVTGFPITNEVAGCLVVTFAFTGQGALTITTVDP